jgi:hypothetical protein
VDAWLTSGLLEPGELNSRPPCGEFIAESRRSQSQTKGDPAGEKAILLILTEQLLTVFNKADDDHDGGADEADEEQELQNSYRPNREDHSRDCSVFPAQI